MGQEEYSTGRRNYKQLSEAERYQIEGMLKAKVAVSEIARLLGRDRRTIQREIQRGLVEQMTTDLRIVRVYKADVGQRIKEERASNKGRSLKIGHHHELANYLQRMICQEKHSPDTALQKLRKRGDAMGYVICTKTVYNYIHSGIFADLSDKDLPQGGRPRRRTTVSQRIARNNTKGRSIEERPSEIEERQEYGHWEMDVVERKRGSKKCLLVLTERSSREERIFLLSAKTQECVLGALNSVEQASPEGFRKVFRSITMDNGAEFLDMSGIEDSSVRPGEKRTRVYYAHAYSAWERGSNENANKLIRRFIPKGVSMDHHSEEDIARIERWINNYPRRFLGYQTALERRRQLLSIPSRRL